MLDKISRTLPRNFNALLTTSPHHIPKGIEKKLPGNGILNAASGGAQKLPPSEKSKNFTRGERGNFSGGRGLSLEALKKAEADGLLRRATFVHGFVGPYSCEAKRESCLAKQNGVPHA